MNLVPGRGLALPRLRTQRLDPHQPHQPPHPLAVNREAVLAQRLGDPPRAEKRPLGEQRVDPPHRLQLVVVGRLALAITSRTSHAPLAPGSLSFEYIPASGGPTQRWLLTNLRQFRVRGADR